MIVITTPTGSIGRQVLERVLAHDADVRVIVRDASRLPAHARERVDVVEGTHDAPDVVARAFDGADAVFWLVPPNPRATSVSAAYLGFSRAACEVFARGGVQRVVGVSALGRGTPMAGHAGLVTASLAMDDQIMATGVAYRALLLPSFMDNLLRQVASIREQSRFVSPLSGDTPFPTCATHDIAAAAAALLLDTTWQGQGSVAVLGPEDLTLNQQANIIGDVLDKPVQFQQIPGDAFKARLTGFGSTEAMAQGTLEMMVAKDAGLDNAEPRTALSSSPTRFRQWCEDVLKPAVLG